MPFIVNNVLVPFFFALISNFSRTQSFLSVSFSLLNMLSTSFLSLNWEELFFFNPFDNVRLKFSFSFSTLVLSVEPFFDFDCFLF